ncbi:MAG: helix-turn-helix transcriptional regulator [Tepidisphaeraceae bacterium]
MAKTLTQQDITDLQRLLDSTSSTDAAQPLPFEPLFDLLRGALPFTTGLVVSTLPRGGLQILQPQRVDEQLVRDYQKALHADDRLTWEAITSQRAVRAVDCWAGRDGFAQSRFYRDLLQPRGLAHAAAASLRAPVFEGYPGAIVLLRGADQGNFTDADLEALGEVARLVDQAMSRVHRSRQEQAECWPRPAWSHHLPVKLFVFDAQLTQRYPRQNPVGLDAHVAEEMRQRVAERLQRLNGEVLHGDRVTIADSRGDLWTFRAVTYHHLPGLGEGAFVLFCLQPECCDWGVLSPSDFHADAELSRLVPATKYMTEHFHRGPTLIDIAKSVHLSPFHFHRCFTELLGITPKHFLLECQINQAKSQLWAAEKDLAKIATECGFAHQSHFTSRFKQGTGLTPTQWRRLIAHAERSSPVPQV